MSSVKFQVHPGERLTYGTGKKNQKTYSAGAIVSVAAEHADSIPPRVAKRIEEPAPATTTPTPSSADQGTTGKTSSGKR